MGWRRGLCLQRCSGKIDTVGSAGTKRNLYRVLGLNHHRSASPEAKGRQLLTRCIYAYPSVLYIPLRGW